MPSLLSAGHSLLGGEMPLLLQTKVYAWPNYLWPEWYIVNLKTWKTQSRSLIRSQFVLKSLCERPHFLFNYENAVLMIIMSMYHGK